MRLTYTIATFQYLTCLPISKKNQTTKHTESTLENHIKIINKIDTLLNTTKTKNTSNHQTQFQNHIELRQPLQRTIKTTTPYIINQFTPHLPLYAPASPETLINLTPQDIQHIKTNNSLNTLFHEPQIEIIHPLQPTINQQEYTPNISEHTSLFTPSDKIEIIDLHHLQNNPPPTTQNSLKIHINKTPTQKTTTKIPQTTSHEKSSSQQYYLRSISTNKTIDDKELQKLQQQLEDVKKQLKEKEQHLIETEKEKKAKQEAKRKKALEQQKQAKKQERRQKIEEKKKQKEQLKKQRLKQKLEKKEEAEKLKLQKQKEKEELLKEHQKKIEAQQKQKEKAKLEKQKALEQQKIKKAQEKEQLLKEHQKKIEAQQKQKEKAKLEKQKKQLQTKKEKTPTSTPKPQITFPKIKLRKKPPTPTHQEHNLSAEPTPSIQKSPTQTTKNTKKTTTQTPTTKTQQSTNTINELDAELKEVLIILDKLLAELPDKTIQDFAQTEQFALYEKVMNRIKK